MEIRDAIREDRCCQVSVLIRISNCSTVSFKLIRQTKLNSYANLLQVCLTNYRKDGTKFLNQFFLSPIKVWLWPMLVGQLQLAWLFCKLCVSLQQVFHV